MALARNILMTKVVSEAVQPNDFIVNKEIARITGDGVDGQTNRIFVDSSPIARTLALTGVVNQSCQTPYFPNWSCFFDGSTNSVSYPGQSSLNPHSSDDFSIEAYVYPTHTENTQIRVIASTRPATGTAYGMSFLLGPANNCYLAIVAWDSAGSVALNLTSGTSLLDLNEWSHVAAVRQSGVWKLYINGSKVSEGSQNGVIYSGSNLVIGKDPTVTTRNFFGHISCVRIQRGTIPYLSNFEPSRQKLVADANTVFLGASTSTLVDESAVKLKPTVSGSVGTLTVSNFTPFSDPADSSYSAYGGSMFTVVGANYVSAASSSDFRPASGDFTISAWVRSTTVDTANGKSILTNRLATPTGGWQLSTGVATSRRLQFSLWSSTGTTRIAINSGTNFIQYGVWTHVAVTKQGSLWRLFINGNVVGGGNQSGDDASGSIMRIGHSPVTDDHTWVGNIADVNIIKGKALWTTNFTPPSLPLEATAQTVLQARFTNAGIFDQKRGFGFATYGSARVSDSIKKKGAGSLIFNGTTDYALSESTLLNDLFKTNSNLTIRFWFKTNNLNRTPHLLTFGTSVNYRVAVYIGTDNKLAVLMRTSSTTAATPVRTPDALLADTWYHVALTKQGDSWNLWLNGALVSTGNSAIIPTGAMYLCLGTQPWSGVANDYLNGNIDDLVIVKDHVEFIDTFDPETL